MIYQFIKPVLENKMSIFEEYGAFKYTEKEIFKCNVLPEIQIYIDLKQKNCGNY